MMKIYRVGDSMVFLGSSLAAHAYDWVQGWAH